MQFQTSRLFLDLIHQNGPLVPKAELCVPPAAALHTACLALLCILLQRLVPGQMKEKTAWVEIKLFKLQIS